MFQQNNSKLSQVRLRNSGYAHTNSKAARASKVTSMIELFSENPGKVDSKPLINHSANQEVIERSKNKPIKTALESRERNSSAISTAVRVPKPYDQSKLVPVKGSVRKPRIDDMSQKRSGYVQRNDVAVEKPQLLLNGTVFTKSLRTSLEEPSEGKLPDPAAKRISRAFDYWEHKIDPRQSTGSRPETKPLSPVRGNVANFESNGSRYKTKTPFHGKNEQGDLLITKVKPRPKSEGSARNAVDTSPTKPDNKPVVPTRPRFMTTTGPKPRLPGPKPFKLGEESRVSSSLHGSSIKDVKTSNFKPPNSPKTTVSQEKPAVLPKKPQTSGISETIPEDHLVPPKQDLARRHVINPLPKPQRTFTFTSADGTRKPANRDLVRVSTDASIDLVPKAHRSTETTLRKNALGGSTPDISSIIPKADYEEVVFFEVERKEPQRSFSSRNIQKWERRHNYEDVDDSFRVNYDHISLDDGRLRRRSFSDAEDGYAHLKFKQDLQQAETRQASVLVKSNSTSPFTQHKKLGKQNSDTSDIMTKENDLSRSQQSLDSGNGRLQIADRIREAFSIIGRRYKHHKKGNELSEDDTNYSTSGDEDSDNEDDLTKHKQTLERTRTLQKTYRQTIKYKSMERDLSGADYSKATLFEQVLISKIVPDQNGKYISRVVYRFPAPPPGKTLGDEKTLAHFCFPDVNELVPCEEMQTQSFSFMLTRENGTRKFGYCRRVLPPGSGPRYPVVYCLISALGSFGLYETILEQLERRHRVALKDVGLFLDSLFVERFPAPGRSIRVEIQETGKKQTPVVLRRPFDTRLEHVDLQCLLYELGIENTIKIFSSLLLERRVILCGRSLGTLTACVHALQALLYPFVWQHVFVPVLPLPMLDLTCSPTPLLIGILETSLEKLKALPLEEVFIVNISTQEVLSSMGDELEILPRKFQTPLMESLVGHKNTGRGEKNTQPNYDHTRDYEIAELNTVISESFMHLFVEMIGHYQNHFQPVADTTNPLQKRHRLLRSFNRMSFYEDVTSCSLRRFLELFMDTQMFDGFIYSREMAGPDYEGLFERRISRHLMTADTSSLNFKVFKTKMKKIFKRK